MNALPRLLCALLSASVLLASAWAVERELPAAFRPRPEAIPAGVLLNGRPLRWSEESPATILPDRLPCGDCEGSDPGGIRPPGSRRLLSFVSDRPDGLASAWYEGGSIVALEARLRDDGWEKQDLGAGLSLWARAKESLVLDAAGPGRPGTSLLYWRLP